MSNNQQKLEFLRKKLNKIDNQIIKLLEERLEVASDVASVKNILKLSMTDPKREKEIIERLKNSTKDLILKETIGKLYQNIFALSKTVRVINTKEKEHFLKIGIIGLGIIGGSIAKTLKVKNLHIQIYTLQRNSENNKKALAEKIIDHEFSNIEELINNVKLIILASSIESIIPLAESIKKYNKKLLVIDVASVKSKISQRFEELSDENTQYLPTHPMAGSEKIGFDGSTPTLFINQPWIITPHIKNNKETVNKISDLIGYLGGIPKTLSPEQHDKSVAIISHLIFLISTYLFAYSARKNVLDLAGTGFESTTRLASGNPAMHNQIFVENYENISKILNEFMEFIKKNKIDLNNSLKFFEENKKNRDQFIKRS